MPSKPGQRLSATTLRSIVDQLSVAILVFRGQRLIYANPQASRLINRLRADYGSELLVMLLDHLAEAGERPQAADAVLALTGADNEPLVVRLMELRSRLGDIAVSIREIGTDIAAFKERYGLSRREIQVAELVLRGLSNSHIADRLGITAATTKKHLSRIFEKVGVDSRAQLSSKLA
jgi:DNA-binding CsgD family transcriptional regulator